MDFADELKEFSNRVTKLKENINTEQLTNPSDQLVKVLIKTIYNGTKTQAVIDKFRELTVIAANEYISDILNDKIQNVISAPAEQKNELPQADF